MGMRQPGTRGVSEMLGFVLLFSIVLISIVSVSVVGMNALQNGRDTVTTENVQASFDRLADTVSEVHQTRADRRSVALPTGSGQISAGEPVTMILRRDGPHSAPLARVEYRPIVFSVGQNTLIYSGTAVIREGPNGAVVTNPPAFQLTSEAAILPVISTNVTGPTSVSGRASARFIQRNESVFYGRNPPGGSPIPNWGADWILLEIQPATDERARAWNESLSKRWDDCQVNPTGASYPHVQCVYYPDLHARVMVHNVSVDYTLST